MVSFAYSAVFFFNNNSKFNKLKFFSFIAFIVLFSTLLIAINLDKSIGFGVLKNVLREILSLGGNGKSGGMIGAFFMTIFFPLFGKNGSIILILILMSVTLLAFGNYQVKKVLRFIFSMFYRKKKNKIQIDETKKSKDESDREVKPQRENSELSKDEFRDVKKNRIIDLDISKTAYVKDNKINKEYEEENKKKINNKPINLKNKVEHEEKLHINEKIELKENNTSGNLEDIFQEKEENKEKQLELENIIKDKIVNLEGLLREYKIDAKVINVERGPVITRFELSVAMGTRVRKIVSLQDDIAMNLEAKSIRIEAPIPGKNAIGIEIPNEITEAVHFANILKSDEMKKINSPLAVILGKNIVGENVIVDLAKMPHLLVAGRTGSGKSVCINTLISTIISKCSYEEVKFIMVDPKMVELMPYNEIPHLLLPVIIDPKQAAVALKWAVNEMENRYKLLSEIGARNIENYNKLNGVEKLSYIVVIIDELADLMMIAPASIEESIARIAQKARAIGIHLVVATQRPSIDVITGTIKANLPSRISFAVASQIDSRTILDGQGAEKLLGRGDMLFLESGSPNLVRIQGAYISDDEIVKLTTYLKSNGKPNYKNEILEDNFDLDKDELYDEAVELIKKEEKVSISLIQRKLKVGYSRAARIFDQLQENGVVSEDREILIDV